MEDIEDTDYVASEHDILVKAISKLDKTQHITEPTRNEPTIDNSEFHLHKRSNELDLSNVVEALEGTAIHVKIGKKLKKIQNKSQVLKKPLEKPQAERIKRAIGYEENKKKIGRWDPVVARARTVDYVSFPIKHVSNKLQSTGEFLSKLKLKSALEKELDEVDPPAEVMEEDEEEQTYPMSYEEMIEHRQHSAKLRAQESYKAAKAKRQSKIKSKKYHRILKKEKLKQQLKEFEDLQKKNPEEALQKLEALEKARALERHTLRHKNTGKWAKNQLIRAKYDKEVRQQIAEQLAVSRSLTHKTQDTESTDDEADNNEAIPDITLSQDPMNPWMLQRSDKSNVDAEFDFGYKKYLKDKMFKRKDNDSESDSNDEDANKMVSEKINSLKESIAKLATSDIEGSAVEEFIVDTNKLNKEIANLKASNNALDKKKKKKSIVATSNWIVEEVGNSIRNDITQEVSSAFENLEDDVANKVEQKLKMLREDIERIGKSEKPFKNTRSKKDTEKDIDNLEYLKLKNQKTKTIIDEELLETNKSKKTEDSDVINSAAKIIETAQHNTQDGVSTDIDPNRFIEVKPKYLNTALSNLDNDNDELDDDQVVPKVNIEEVFEEDDVVASFRQEKEDEAKKDQPTDIDLSLPGWGSWGGKGVKAPKRKRNRFILKAPPKMPRRDENKGDVIIKEYKDPKMAVHKVTDVPFPFTSIKEYEASIRAPIGNTFIPESAHKKLIRPSVITKAGTIIEPMDEEELLLQKNRNFSNNDVLRLLAKK
ncbi:unnamed protein product [Chilo suppressalis]|uniref:U3 small nucleolar RNA-associated protein 14 homolog A n=1 Tax=Chilo suppressalis TaxID=168631 RepID=A0ABN8B2V8_CHISP|nr:hypothetical protein evm_009853 [Chilo suppressalis]CAH0400963.1 unnamed protein product [Chilo suppressalis]